MQDLSDSLVIRLLSVYKSSSVSIKDERTNAKVSYVPLTGISVGAGVTHKWLGVNIAGRIPGSDFSSGDNKTKGLDLRVHSFGRRFGFDASLAAFSGYETDDVEETPDGFSDEFRKDLYSTVLSFSGYFNMNPSKFSLRAVSLQNERQLKSAGAPILGMYANFLTLGTTDSVAVLNRAFLPRNDVERYFSSDLHFKKVNSYNVGLDIGYVYTLVFKKKFFTTVGLNLGLGYDYSKYAFHDAQVIDVSQLQLFDVWRFALGYNNIDYYLGITSYIERNTLGADEHRISFSSGEVRLVFAKRFSGKFGFLNKLYSTKIAKLFAPKEKK